MMRATLNCLVCGRPAVTWGGHVHKGGIRLLSGWCADHAATAEAGRPKSRNVLGRNCVGCDGDWLEKDGEMPDE